MIIGYDYFSQPFNTSNNINKYTRLELSNAIFDEIQGFNSITEAYNKDKSVWSYTMVLDAKFQDDLEGGNVNLNGLEIEKLLFQKRKQDELTWNTVAEMDYDKAIQVYNLIDRYIENYTPYEYALIPITTTVKGDRSVGEITPSFEGVFLTDKENNYHILYNLELGDFDYNSPTALLEPYSGQFPFVMSGELNYRQSTLKGTILSPNTENQTGTYSNGIDLRQQKLTRESLIKFLNNHKPKLVRLNTGDMWLVSILGNPKFSPINELQGTIGDVSFEFVEIGDANSDTDLIDNGLL